jgi:cell division protein FtsL
MKQVPGREQKSHMYDTRAHAKAGAAGHGPVLKLRQLVMGTLCVVVLIMWPMFMVWKQIYITNVSLKESALSDSLVALSKESATLRLYNEKLAGTQRIESIARSSLGLEYPTSQQIVVVREGRRGERQAPEGKGFLAVLRRTFSRERG